VSEGTQNLQQQTQDQYLQEAQEYFGQSMGRIKGRMQSDSAQLEGLMQQLPEESQAQVQEMTDSYAQFEATIDQAAQDAGVQDTVDEAAQQARQSADEASGQGQEPVDQAAGQMQETVGQATDQVQETVGGVAGQAGETVGGVAEQAGETVGGVADQAQETADQATVDPSQLAENLPPGYEAMGEPTTDEDGNFVQRAADAQGNTVDYTFDPQGNQLGWVAVDDEAVETRPSTRPPLTPASWRRACLRATRRWASPPPTRTATSSSAPWTLRGTAWTTSSTRRATW
jgi:hypothetical protein